MLIIGSISPEAMGFDRLGSVWKNAVFGDSEDDPESHFIIVCCQTFSSYPGHVRGRRSARATGRAVRDVSKPKCYGRGPRHLHKTYCWIVTETEYPETNLPLHTAAHRLG